MSDVPDARLPFASGWKVLDVLVKDSAGERFLVQCADGTLVEAVEPPEEEQSALAFRERQKAKATRARAAEHASLVPTLGYAEDAGRLFVVEPYVDGISLAELMETHGRLDPDAVLEIGAHAAAALDALHRAGLVHGWVRPDALVVTDEEAFLRDAAVEHPKGEDAAPPDFMSPEQLSADRRLRPESDFFSLGSTLFAAIVGRPPFTGATRDEIASAVREGRATFPARDEPHLSHNLALLFAKLLAPDHERRPRSAEELIRDLASVRRGERVDRVTDKPPAPAGPRAAASRARRGPALVAVVGAVIVLALAAVLFWPRDRRPPDTSARGPAPTTRPARTTAPALTTGPAAVRQPPDGRTREDRAADALAAAEKYAAEHPQDFGGALARLRDVAAAFAGTPASLKAEQKATELALRKTGAQLAQFDEVQAEADRLIAERRFGSAIAAFDRYEVLATPPGGVLPQGLRDRVARQIGFVRAKAAESYARESADAAKAVNAERYEDAIRIYEAVLAQYGIEEYVQQARRELAILRPLLEARGKAAAEKLTKELEAAYRETAAEVQKLVREFDLERAVARSEELLGRLKGSALEANAANHLAHLNLLLALKSRTVEKINAAGPKVECERLGVRAAGAVIQSADAAGVTLRSNAGDEKRRWAELSDWEKYSIARYASDTDSRGDLTALGLLSLEQGNLARAGEDLRRAQGLGADVADLLARTRETAAPAPTADAAPERMLVEALALVADKKWLDALVLLIPLKEKHAASNYAVREKLDEINRMLARCSDGLARADVERDLASGAEAALLAAGLDGWDKTGKGWSSKDTAVRCENADENDVELWKTAPDAPAYRLTVRCRVVSGNGLLVRLASVGEDRYDFWLELADKSKTALLQSVGGKVQKAVPVPVTVAAGEWIEVRAIVTARHVRVECGGQGALMPNVLKADPAAKRTIGLVTRQKSVAEFEDFRLRVLREQ